MKVCPINKYGAKVVMEHYVQTGQVLGKGTHDLEGYTLHPESSEKYAFGYFGPGELPTFNTEFFDIPKGTREDATMDEYIRVIEQENHSLKKPEDDQALFAFRDRLREVIKGEGVSDSTMF